MSITKLLGAMRLNLSSECMIFELIFLVNNMQHKSAQANRLLIRPYLYFVRFLPYFYFGPRVYRRGSLVIALVRGLSVFKYLRDRSLVFSNFLHEVRAP